jgi:hypothetical protein
MHSLSIPYPDDWPITSGKPPQTLEAELAFYPLVSKLQRGDI